MSAILLRRRKLGRGSCNGIANVSTTGIKVVRNWVGEDWPTERMSYVFRWGCTSSIPAIPDEQPVIVNTAKAIHWCSDKRQSRLDMQDAGVPVPKTWDNVHEMNTAHSVVWRTAQHAQGRNLFLYNPSLPNDRGSLIERCHRQGLGQYYISEFINKVAEYRVMVVQNRVAWVAKKTPGNPEDVAWNVAQGGRFDNVRWGEWPLRVVAAALQAAKVGELDFCGVDVMVDAEGNPYVLEVNSAPSQTSPYRQQCLAKCFDYIVTHGKQHFSFGAETPRSWKGFIHPAVWSSSRG